MAHVVCSGCIGNHSIQWQPFIFPRPFPRFLICSPGTGIWFYGANRPGYGSYSVSIDGQSISGNAQSQNASFRQLLAGRSGLTNGPHTAVLTNTGSGSPIDLDAIVFETQVGSVGCVLSLTACVVNRSFIHSTEMTKTMMDDTNPAITYLPKSEDWVFDKLRGCYNTTVQCVLHSQTLSYLRRCIPSSSALPRQGAHKRSSHSVAKRLPSMGRFRQPMRTTPRRRTGLQSHSQVVRTDLPVVFMWA